MIFQKLAGIAYFVSNVPTDTFSEKGTDEVSEKIPINPSDEFSEKNPMI